MKNETLTLSAWKQLVIDANQGVEVVFLLDETGELPPGSVIAVPKGGESLAIEVCEDDELFGYFDLTTGVAMVGFDDQFEAIA